MRQFSAARYYADFDESPATAPEDVANIDVLAWDLEFEGD